MTSVQWKKEALDVSTTELMHDHTEFVMHDHAELVHLATPVLLPNTTVHCAACDTAQHPVRLPSLQASARLVETRIY